MRRSRRLSTFDRKSGAKLAAVPSSYNASASTCKPLLDKAAMKVNGAFLRVGINVPKDENGIGLRRKQSAVNMPI